MPNKLMTAVLALLVAGSLAVSAQEVGDLAEDIVPVLAPGEASGASVLPQATMRVRAAGAPLFLEVEGQCSGVVDGGAVGTVLEERPGWYRLRFEEGLEGWVRASAVELPTDLPPRERAIVTKYYKKLGAEISYPAEVATAKAIDRLASGQAKCRPGRCAAAVREALGWGLGDASQWAKLPTRGFASRPKGTFPEPGDIVVWPFTYGSRSSQHIGFAVEARGEVTLLSNLTGRLCLSAIVPGYASFEPPAEAAEPWSVAWLTRPATALPRTPPRAWPG